MADFVANEILVYQPNEIVSACTLCGHPRYASGVETHSTICTRFRALEAEVRDLKSRSGALPRLESEGP